MSQRSKIQKGMCFKADKRGVSVQAGRIYEQLSKPPGLGEEMIFFFQRPREYCECFESRVKEKRKREGGAERVKKKGDRETRKGQK